MLILTIRHNSRTHLIKMNKRRTEQQKCNRSENPLKIISHFYLPSNNKVLLLYPKPCRQFTVGKFVKPKSPYTSSVSLNLMYTMFEFSILILFFWRALNVHNLMQTNDSKQRWWNRIFLRIICMHRGTLYFCDRVELEIVYSYNEPEFTEGIIVSLVRRFWFLPYILVDRLVHHCLKNRIKMAFVSYIYN